MGIKIYLENLIDKKGVFVKHNPIKLKKIIFRIKRDYKI